MIKKNFINFETIVNISIIIAVIVVTGIIVKRYFFDSNEPIQKIEVGNAIYLPNIDWKSNQKTVILALNENCSHCTESAPYLRQLLSLFAKGEIKFEVVTKDTKEVSQEYLKKLGLATQQTHQISLRKYGFSGTPTILFIDQNGLLKDMWVGRISEKNIEKVTNKFVNLFQDNSENNLDNLKNSDDALLEVAEKKVSSHEVLNLINEDKKLFILDIDTREEFKNLHIANSKNIPGDEIVSRMREIPKDKKVVLYGRCAKDSVSRSSQKQLESMGYSDVWYLSGGIKNWKEFGFPVEKLVSITEE